jgi:4-phosphopantoate--beta-alanine ligase
LKNKGDHNYDDDYRNYNPHFHIPPTHPRAQSLLIRAMLIEGYRKGLVASEGLIAHGRGEAFDYLLGERTSSMAQCAIEAATSALLLSRFPVISVNGNLVALCAKTVVELSQLIGAKIEVNLFYRSTSREKIIKRELERFGAKEILGVDSSASAVIPELQSERRQVDPNGIMKADTVLVPLEDGDRAQALVRMGKTVVAIDLNPGSRTARSANITIVDNAIRAIPKMIVVARKMKELERKQRERVLKRIVKGYDNQKNLLDSLSVMRGDFGKLKRRRE